MTTATEGQSAAPGARLPAPAAAAGRAARRLGWAAAAAITASVLLMIAVLAAGPSAVVPRIPRTWPAPPLWLAVHPSVMAATIMIYSAIVLGAAGVCCGLVAVWRGARPSIRLLAGGSVIAVVALALLPPGGSTDSLSYAAYGRIALLGHNPYVMVPAQLRAMGDPIGLQTTRNWASAPSLYGPTATAVNWVAARLGGSTISYVILWLKLIFAASFVAVAAALDRVLRRDPAARARAHLLWTVNPLMLWAVVGGAHADGLGAALGILGILVARTRPAAATERTGRSGEQTGPHSEQTGRAGEQTGRAGEQTGPSAPVRIGMVRALAAGALVGAAVGIKAPLFPLALGLAWSARRSLRDLAAVTAGGVLVMGTGYLIAGRAAITDLWTTGNALVTFDSFWRLFYSPFGYTREPAGLSVIAALAFVVMAALLAWRLPPGPQRLPAVRPALVVMVAWLLVWPLQRPWYDAAAFCLLAVFPASRLDWLMLVRAVPAAIAVANGAGTAHPRWLTRLILIMGDDVSRFTRLAAAVAAVALCCLAAWNLRRPRRERPGPRRAVPS